MMRRITSRTASWPYIWRSSMARSPMPITSRWLGPGRRRLAAVVEELEHEAVEALDGFDHHHVAAVLDRHEVRVGDLVGELSRELGRGEGVVAAADDERALADAAQAVRGVVGEAGVALAGEDVGGEGRVVARQEAHHRV